jgi:hypothetical protein
MAKNFESGKSGETVIGGIARGDDTPRHARIVKENKAMLFVPPILAATFAGKQFFYSEAFELAATTDTRDYVFQTPNTTEWAHLIFDGTGNAITEVALFEDTELTTTSDYTEQTTFNNNRNSTDTADCKLYLCGVGLSTTDSGTRLLHQKSGSATNQSKTPADHGYGDELFLKSNTYYRFMFRTYSASNLCNITLQWHEHTNDS